MTLEELLNHTRHVILRDSQAPALWSDTTLALYLNEAATIFARRTHCLVSDDEEFCTLTTVENQARYKLDSRIIYIMHIEDENGCEIRNRGRNRVPYGVSNGKPLVYTADSSYKGVRLYPTPDDEVHTLTMLVAHKPTKKMSHKQHSPEIPEEYHSSLGLYAAYKSLMNNGPEGGDTTAAEPFRVEWEIVLRDAKRDAYHMRASPNAAVVNNWTGGRR